GHLLLDQQMRQFVAEGIARGGVGEISALFTPANNGIGNASDQLADRRFAIGSAHLAVKILARDNVRGGLRPTSWYFDIFLAEDGHALFVADEGDALFPFDSVEGRLLPVGEVPRKGQTFPRACGPFSPAPSLPCQFSPRARFPVSI